MSERLEAVSFNFDRCVYSLSLQQQAASRLIIDAGSAGHAGPLGLKLMTLISGLIYFFIASSLKAKPEPMVFVTLISLQ
jgi:hypothetical protein